MKAVIKLKTAHLKSVIDGFYDTPSLPPASRQQKVVESISRELMIKLERKLISKRHEEHKEFKISLKFYEVFALMEICKYLYAVADSEFAQNTVRLIIAQLDRQL